MTLDSRSRFPANRRYVLKLDRDCGNGRPLHGKIENVSTGTVRSFATAAELLDCLTAELADATASGTGG